MFGFANCYTGDLNGKFCTLIAPIFWAWRANKAKSKSGSPLILISWRVHNRVQGLCESRGGRPGLPVLMSLVVSVDVKQHWAMLRHWSQFVPNNNYVNPTSEDIKLCIIIDSIRPTFLLGREMRLSFLTRLGRPNSPRIALHTSSFFLFFFLSFFFFFFFFFSSSFFQCHIRLQDQKTRLRRLFALHTYGPWLQSRCEIVIMTLLVMQQGP